MLRAKRKLQLLVFGVVGTIHGSAFGEELGKAAQEAASEGSKHATDLITKFKIAFGMGGEKVTDAMVSQAQGELIGLASKATFYLALLYISYLIASALGRYIGGMVSKKVDLTLGKFLDKAVRNGIMVIVALVALEGMGVSVTGFAAMLAALSFAIGMALQGTLQNFAAGIMLLVFRPFKVEDYIVVADTEGTVEEIDLFTTRLNALDNRHLIIPNGEIFGAKLENYTRNALRRVDVNVGAAYNADLQTTRQALTHAATVVNKAFVESAGHVNVPQPQVYLMELGASSVDWQLRVWCRPEDYWGVREALTGAAKESLDQSGISIPFPQMDVHVVGKMVTRAAEGGEFREAVA